MSGPIGDGDLEVLRNTPYTEPIAGIRVRRLITRLDQTEEELRKLRVENDDLQERVDDSLSHTLMVVAETRAHEAEVENERLTTENGKLRALSRRAGQVAEASVRWQKAEDGLAKCGENPGLRDALHKRRLATHDLLNAVDKYLHRTRLAARTPSYKGEQ